MNTQLESSLRTKMIGLAATLVLALSSDLWGGVIPPNLPPGAQYQLVFVTAGTRGASSSDVADYNAFVTAQAALNPLLPSTTWHALASTTSVAAATNAPAVGLPLYNTHGVLLLPQSAYGVPLLNPISYDQHGNLRDTYVWTGTYIDGLAFPGGELGSATPAFGRSTETDYDLLAINLNTDNTFPKSFYAVSTPITVPVPEPAAGTLAATGLAICVGAGWWRRRR